MKDIWCDYMDKKEYYVIQNKEKKFFAIDNMSGGYPCFVDNFEFCERYNSKQSAIDFLNSKYVESFKREFKDCIIKKVSIIIE